MKIIVSCSPMHRVLHYVYVYLVYPALSCAVLLQQVTTQANLLTQGSTAEEQ